MAKNMTKPAKTGKSGKDMTTMKNMPKKMGKKGC